jgi:hypothetical protein
LHSWVYRDGIPLSFCLGLPWTEILLVSTFWVTGITGKHHHTQRIELENLSYDFTELTPRAKHENNFSTD